MGDTPEVSLRSRAKELRRRAEDMRKHASYLRCHQEHSELAGARSVQAGWLENQLSIVTWSQSELQPEKAQWLPRSPPPSPPAEKGKACALPVGRLQVGELPSHRVRSCRAVSVMGAQGARTVEEQRADAPPSKRGPNLGRLPRRALKGAPPPNYSVLPPSLRFPNPEAIIVTMFASGIISSCAAVLGAWHGRSADINVNIVTWWHVALAVGLLLFLVGFYTWEFRRLWRFHHQHRVITWVAAELPAAAADVEDPMLRLLAHFRVLAPRHRNRGEFEIPKEDTAEPMRSERALRDAFDWPLIRCVGRRLGLAFTSTHAKFGPVAGDDFEMLPLWLGDAAGSKTGIWYALVLFVLQITMSITTGLLFAHPWALTSAGSQMQLAMLIVTQIIAALWTGATASAVDIVGGGAESLKFFFEATGTSLFLASAIVVDVMGEDEGHLQTLIQMAGWAVQLLMAAIFVPLLLTACTSAVTMLMP